MASGETSAFLSLDGRGPGCERSTDPYMSIKAADFHQRWAIVGVVEASCARANLGLFSSHIRRCTPKLSVEPVTRALNCEGEETDCGSAVGDRTT